MDLPSGEPFEATLELTAGLVYSTVCLMTAVYLGCKMCSEGLPTGLLLAALLAAVFEGGASVFNTVNENLIYRGLCSASAVCMRNSAIWMIMQSIAGSFFWIVAMYVLMTQMKPRLIWMTAISLGVVLGLLGAMLMLAGGAEVSMLLFFAWFEPMMVMLVVAGCRLMSKDGAAGRFFTVAALGVMLVHYYQLSFVFIPEMRYSYSMILKNALNCIAFPLLWGASVVSVARSQAVKDNIRKAQTSDARKVTNEIKNVYVFPEYWWGLSLPLLLLGYGLSFLCFYYIAKPDMNKSPIVFMYHTYHPCVLLDYLPGTLFAQPFFTLCEICYQITVVVAFIRTLCYGHLPSILHSAFTTIWVLVFTSTFPLVSTFNPSETNALLHSSPFIFHQSAIAFWVLSQMGIMMSVSDKILVGNRKYFAGYACMFAMAELGGMCWMISMLLNNYGYGERAGQGPAVNNNADIDNSDIKFDPIPFVLAVAQIFNCWGFSILSPFKFRPLAFDLRAHDFLDKEYEPERISPDRIGRKFHVKVGGRSFLLAFVVCALLTSTMAVGLNLAVMGPEVWTWGFRNHLRNLPGAAVGAVGWTVCCVLILVHVVSVGVFEYMKNSSPLGTLGVHLMGGVLVLTSLSAHASTIPLQNEEYPWFLGTEAFQFALILWIAVGIKLSFNGADGQSPSTPNLALDTISGLAAIAATLVSLFLGFGTAGNPYADTAALLLVGVFCFSDARNMSVIMNHIHIATDIEVPKAFQSEGFFGVPCFTMDIHGIGKLFQSKSDQTELTKAAA